MSAALVCLYYMPAPDTSYLYVDAAAAAAAAYIVQTRHWLLSSLTVITAATAVVQTYLDEALPAMSE